MSITIQLPPGVEEDLRRQDPKLDEKARDEFLLANYQNGKLSTSDIAEVLGFETRHEAQIWLAKQGVPINYTKRSLEEDRKSIQELFGKE
jgi:predicted HTH domain antitoxin